MLLNFGCKNSFHEDIAMTDLTPNQMMLLNMAAKNADHWHDISGVCLLNQFNGKGRSQVVRGLVQRGLIESRLINVGIRRRIMHECIMLTEAGRDLIKNRKESK